MKQLLDSSLNVVRISEYKWTHANGIIKIMVIDLLASEIKLAVHFKSWYDERACAEYGGIEMIDFVANKSKQWSVRCVIRSYSKDCVKRKIVCLIYLIS